MSVIVDVKLVLNVLRISPLKTIDTQRLQIPLYQHFKKWNFHENGLKSTHLDKIDTNSHHKID